MADPHDSNELALVLRAITESLTTSGCLEWQDRAACRVRARPPCGGLTPEGIKRLLCDFVVQMRGRIDQVIEKRQEYSEFRFYYKVVVPVEGLARGLFVELVLVDDDPEYPTVLIVNAHEQSR